MPKSTEITIEVVQAGGLTIGNDGRGVSTSDALDLGEMSLE